MISKSPFLLLLRSVPSKALGNYSQWRLTSPPGYRYRYFSWSRRANSSGYRCSISEYVISSHTPCKEPYHSWDVGTLSISDKEDGISEHQCFTMCWGHVLSPSLYCACLCQDVGELQGALDRIGGTLERALAWATTQSYYYKGSQRSGGVCRITGAGIRGGKETKEKRNPVGWIKG